MSTQLETSIVRIRTHDGIVVGAGFLVTEKLVLTCAHVVAQALDIPQNTSEIPTDNISLDFPLVAAGENVTAKVIKWLPVQSDESGDLACLELLSNPPKEARPTLLITEDKLWGHAFRAFGFPTGYDNGVWASGVLRAKQADGWVQIEDTKQTGYFIEPGFSGTAIWDEEVNGVVGMTVVAERRAEVRAAFVIPISLILELLPELEQQTIPPCPYRGLFAFREQDAEFFFGRETYTEQLAKAVQNNPFVAVIGASGSGKSSVVYAGLIPQLRKTPGVCQTPGVSQWIIASFRPGDNPFQALSKALIPFLYTDELERISKVKQLTEQLHNGEISLSDVIERILEKDGKAEKFLLFADQFEELYTLCREENERRQFLDELLSILPISPSPQPPIFSLVLTMRADFLSKALSYRPFADTLQDASMMLGPMNREELRATIKRPAQMLDVEVEEGLTDRILDAVSGEPGNLPLLEFALTELWKKQHGGMLTHVAYDEIGGVERALMSYAESVYESLNPEEQERAKHIFVQLVRPGEGTEDIRRVAHCADIGEENWKLVTKLADARLVVTGSVQMDASSESGAHLEETVEVVHEAMIRGWQRLREWMETDREFRVWQESLRSAVRLWERNRHDEGALLRGSILAEAEKWFKKKKADLSSTEQNFIEDSLLLSYRLKKEQRELETAREIQMALLPKETPLLERVEIGTLYRAASQVGGDWYDFFWVSENELGIVIADVTGKGIPGSLMMMMAKAVIRAMAVRSEVPDRLLPVGVGGDPASVIRKANQMIANLIKRDMFITANYGILNVNTLRFQFVSAGHNDTLVYNSRTGELREYNPKGIALGLDMGKLFDMLLQDQALTLSAGDLLFQYTNGVNEAMNTRKEEFGEERLKEVIRKYADQSVNDFLSSLDQEIRTFTKGFPQSDDIAAVAIKVVNGPSSGDPSSGSSVIEVIEDVEEIEEIEVIEELEKVPEYEPAEPSFAKDQELISPPPKNSKGPKYDIELVNIGKNRGQILYILSKIEGLSKSPQELVDAIPSIIVRGAKERDAKNFQVVMQSLGCSVRLIRKIEVEDVEVIEELEDGEELEELEELEDVEVIEELEKVEEVGMIEKLLKSWRTLRILERLKK